MLNMLFKTVCLKSICLFRPKKKVERDCLKNKKHNYNILPGSETAPSPLRFGRTPENEETLDELSIPTTYVQY